MNRSSLWPRSGQPLVWVMTAALGLWSAARAGAQEVAPTELPVAPYKANDKGLVVAQVQFAVDGKVAACRIVRSNVPYPLEAATVDYIKRKWIDDAFAGETVNFPLTFDSLPWYAKSWNEGLVPPPNLLPAGDPGRKLKLRVTFGPDGWVQHVQVMNSTGIDLMDREASVWVKVHWHNEAFAGQTVDAPFEFKPSKPSLPKEPAAKPKPVAVPAEPAEPTAPPAVRVE
jgi:hypothetical protein